MANEVYANSNELACKAGSGKSICCFPDVCMTPPENPATPPGVPVPYPNTGMASDTTDGSRTVKISDQEIMLKDKSYFKRSTGDEAGCAAKKGVVTSVNKGEVYFTSWSMDVKIEGENVDRHLDMTIHNEACAPPNTGPWMFADASAFGDPAACLKEQERINDACREYTPKGFKDPCEVSKPPQEGIDWQREREARKIADRIAAETCLSARRCALQPYKPRAADKKQGFSCCAPQTGHHLIEASAVAAKRGGTPLEGVQNYNLNRAPCICAEGPSQHTGTHGLIHSFQSEFATSQPDGSVFDIDGNEKECKVTNYGAARDNAATCVTKVFPESGCDERCIKAQLDAYHKENCKMKDSTPIEAVREGNISVSDAQREVAARTNRIKLSRVLGESVFI